MPTSEDRPEGRPETQAPHLDDAASKTAATARMQNQTKWVDLQVQQSIQRGEFDDLPGAGKPIKNLDRDHDPDWWVKQLVEREQIVVLPDPSSSARTTPSSTISSTPRRPRTAPAGSSRSSTSASSRPATARPRARR